MDKNLPELLTIVEVDKQDRIFCGAEGCKKSVYKRIHVVRDSGRLLLLGEICFLKRYADQKPLISASHSKSSKRLSKEERQMLLENTEALLQHLVKRFQISRFDDDFLSGLESREEINAAFQQALNRLSESRNKDFRAIHALLIELARRRNSRIDKELEKMKETIRLYTPFEAIVRARTHTSRRGVRKRKWACKLIKKSGCSWRVRPDQYWIR
mgnify:CR=1 FL=1